MLDDDHAGIEDQDKTLCNENLHVIVRGTDLPHDGPWGVYESIIVSQHPKGEVKASGRHRQVKKRIRKNDCFGKHPALGH
jgi:hypothetical protein